MITLYKFIYKKIMKPLALKIKVDITNSLDGETLLDIGYCDGKFQSKSNKKYFGIDNNPEEIIPNSKKVSIEDFKTEERFDIVCAFNILEHTLDPVEVIKKIKTLSKKYICVSIPHEPNYTATRLFIRENKEHYWSITHRILKYYFGEPIMEELHFCKREYLAIFKV